MKNKIKILREDPGSKVLVVTPLLKGHKISKETKKTIKRNKEPFIWITSEGNNNIPTNVEIGMLEYKKKRNHLPEYILPLDRDIILGRCMIDRMVKVLDILPDEIAYTYANFEFKGSINKKFPAIEFNPDALMFNNYISSNSLIKIKYLDAIGGFIKDEKYKRLLDWCLWLKFYQHGYVGMPTPNANFIATSTKNDISAGTQRDFEIKRKRVLEDFIKPIIDKQTKKEEPNYDEESPFMDDILTF